MTNWMDVNCGLKQGSLLSPMLLNIYISDLVDKLKKAGFSICVNIICVILYADDIVIFIEI